MRAGRLRPRTRAGRAVVVVRNGADGVARRVRVSHSHAGVVHQVAVHHHERAAVRGVVLHGQGHVAGARTAVVVAPTGRARGVLTATHLEHRSGRDGVHGTSVRRPDVRAIVAGVRVVVAAAACAEPGVVVRVLPRRHGVERVHEPIPRRRPHEVRRVFATPSFFARVCRVVRAPQSRVGGTSRIHRVAALHVCGVVDIHGVVVPRAAHSLRAALDVERRATAVEGDRHRDDEPKAHENRNSTNHLKLLPVFWDSF